LSAIPQYAIPHAASRASTALNPSIAWLNWKECSSATARLNSFCAGSLQDVAKCTVPNISPCWCSCPRIRGQEHQHGEILGTVHFATSCNEPAQKEFNRAVALLHSFQFSHAIEGFNAVLARDAACGIAYWGIAL